MNLFRITFNNRGKFYEIYAEDVSNSAIAGFIEVSGLHFGETSKVLIDPEQEKLAQEFHGVDKTLIPVYSVVRIDSVDKKGQSRILEGDAISNVTPFPGFPSPKE